MSPYAKSLQPSLSMVAALGAAAAVCAESSSRYAALEKDLKSGLVHFGVGAACFGVVVVVAYLLTSKEELAIMKDLVRRKKKDKED